MIRVLVASDYPMVRAGLQALLDGAEDVAVVGQAAGGDELAALVDELGPGGGALAAGGGRRGGPGEAAGEALTARELEVLALVAEGLPNKTIASRLHLSE